MTVLVVGATGATGRLLVKDLLDRGVRVRAIIRSADRLSNHVGNHPGLTIVHASVLTLSEEELMEQVAGCSAVVSCLGHSMSLKGVYGAPRRLVADATRKLCEAIASTNPAQPVRFLLMNSAGCSNRDLDEPRSLAHRFVIGAIRLLVPPHVDNEKAADYLRSDVGHGASFLEWVVVRPDTLVDEERVTAYEVHPSPIRDPIFDAGRTSRSNVAHFMAELIVNDVSWSRWKGRMPVIYNQVTPVVPVELPIPAVAPAR